MVEQQQTNVEPLKYSLDFETYLITIFNSFAGMKGNLKKLDTGEYLLEYERDIGTEPVGNDKGGKHLVNNIRLIMNRYAAFGSLTRDEIADITSNIIRATITPMFVYTDMFGITSLSVLENFGLNLFESVYTYLTSIKDGGLKQFGKDISTVTYVQKPAPTEEKTGLYS